MNEKQLTVADSFDRAAPTIYAALPENINPEKFRSVCLRAVQENPDLRHVDDKPSLFLACQRAATDGLMPDGREGALVVFNSRQKNGNFISGVSWMPMIGGIRKRLADVGFDLIARVVYENDTFDFEEGDNQYIVHRPAPLGQPRGKPIGAYAKAQDLKTGKWYQQVMRVDEIEKVRKVAKTQKVWGQWWDRMACKTVARLLSNELPIPSDTEAARRFWAMIKGDNDNYELSDGISMTSDKARLAQEAARQRSQNTPVIPFASDDSEPPVDDEEEDEDDLDDEPNPGF